MGHERIGLLPKTKRWRKIVGQIASGAGGDFNAPQIAQHTLYNVRKQFRDAENDRAMEAAFVFLVELARASNDPTTLFDLLPPNTVAATPLKIAKALRDATNNESSSAEYQSLADSAATDAIALWFEQHKVQASLFPDQQYVYFDVWHQAGTAAGFCELSRLYFSKYVERYLNYFLEREASAVLPNLTERNRFKQEMHSHTDDISRHAFETSKIMQSYAAGWFNNHAAQGKPSEEAIRSFLSYVFGKIRSELLREGVE